MGNIDPQGYPAYQFLMRENMNDIKIDWESL